jgi:YHS domain-containing protein
MNDLLVLYEVETKLNEATGTTYRFCSPHHRTMFALHNQPPEGVFYKQGVETRADAVPNEVCTWCCVELNPSPVKL